MNISLKTIIFKNKIIITFLNLIFGCYLLWEFPASKTKLPLPANKYFLNLRQGILLCVGGVIFSVCKPKSLYIFCTVLTYTFLFFEIFREIHLHKYHLPRYQMVDICTFVLLFLFTIFQWVAHWSEKEDQKKPSSDSIEAKKPLLLVETSSASRKKASSPGVHVV